MSSRRRDVLRRLGTGIVLLVLSTAYTLTLNAASNEKRWPGPLDWLRLHSFQASAYLLVVIAAFTVYSELRARRTSEEDPTGSAAVTTGDGSPATAVGQNHGGITAVAGDYHAYHNVTFAHAPLGEAIDPQPRTPSGPAALREVASADGEADGSDHARSVASAESRDAAAGGPLRILLYKTPSVGGDWRRVVYEVVAEYNASGVQVSIEHWTAEAIQTAPVDVLILIYRATFHATESHEVYGLAKKCCDLHPSACQFIAAADLSDAEGLEHEIFELLRVKEISAPVELLIQQDLDSFRQWLTEQIGNTIMMGSIGDRSPASSPMPDSRPGGGAL